GRQPDRGSRARGRNGHGRALVAVLLSSSWHRPRRTAMPTKAEENAMLLDRWTVPGSRSEAVIRDLEGNRTLGARLFAPNYIEHKPWSGPSLQNTVRSQTALPKL